MNRRESSLTHRMNRRDAMFNACGGLGGIALTWLLQQEAAVASTGPGVQSLAARQPTFSPRAEEAFSGPGDALAGLRPGDASTRSKTGTCVAAPLARGPALLLH